ncbi:MAG: GGDEF domain-containing protein [Candidatus Omnitrophica bacterium]|nr:GGDEF domain-containing protein [Candidatus Omnitrophota bacterium]
MKLFSSSVDETWTKRSLLVAAFLVLFVIGYWSTQVLNQVKATPLPSDPVLSSLLLALSIPCLLGWFTLPGIVLFVIGPITCVLIVLAAWVTQTPSYLLFLIFEALLCFLLSYLDQEQEGTIVAQHIEIEKMVNEKNDLELAFQEEGTGISVLFEKYTSYYNLRNLAIDFSATLSLKDLSQTIVTKSVELIGHGVSCFLYLAESETGELSLSASRSGEGERKTKSKVGTLFDFWVLRNKQSLIVTDTQKDFRFDPQKIVDLEDTRSVVASPLLHEGKVVGTLRINSPNPSALSTDDLRLLDAIATLASSAITNSILFQKTEELAIRDSLTGLYVQRYFLERLTDEHKRSLLTNAPLTLLIGDLDHFKACNDRYGHGVGDYVLARTAEILQKKAGYGIVARYGGEEFGILLPKISLQDGIRLAESLREALAESQISVRRSEIPITISIGVAAIPSDTLDSEELIRIADRRLYQAKAKGRNRVCGVG